MSEHMRETAAVRTCAPADVGDSPAAADAAWPADLADLDPVAERVTRFALASDVVFPVLPTAVAEVIELANHGNAQFREVDRVVRHDPVLAARVLSVANSPVFRPPGPITSLRVALMRLGWNNLRSILLQAVAETHLFPRGPRREIASARGHAIAVAHLHRQLAQSLGLDGEHAFACGLLHDLGRPMLHTLLARADAPVLDNDRRILVVDRLHCHVGERVAQAWTLPEVIVRTCRHHHDDVPSGSASRVDGAMLAISEALADRCGVGSVPALAPEAADALFGRLGLDDAELKALFDRAAELCRELA
jgi:putative nucleotidyltransferase with HDIG domain